MNILLVNDHENAVRSSVVDTYVRHNSNNRFPLSGVKLQVYFEADHECEILEIYPIASSQPALVKLDSKYIIDIRHWYKLKFKSPEDVTMFLLKWI